MMQLYQLSLCVPKKQKSSGYYAKIKHIIICISCYDLDKKSCSSRPSLKDLVNRVSPDVVAIKWYELGLELLEQKHEHELEIIGKDARDDAKISCRKMFKRWLEIDEEASWEKVIQALRIIELDNVASGIEELLLQGGYM